MDTVIFTNLGNGCNPTAGQFFGDFLHYGMHTVHCRPIVLSDVVWRLAESTDKT